MGSKTNPAVFVGTTISAVIGATIPTVWSLILVVVGDINLAAVVWWAARPIRRRLSEPLFRRFGHWTSTTSSSIGRAAGVGCLLNI